MFVEQADGCQSPIGFHYKDLAHVVGITQADTLSGEAVIDFVFHLVNGDNTIGRDAPFNLQQENPVDLVIGEAPDLLRLRKEAVVWALSMERRMDGKVVSMDKCEKAPLEFLKGMEMAHVKPGHPLVLHGAEPALDLGFSSGGIRLAVA